MSTQRFQSVVTRSDDRVYVEIPFDPDAVWGERDRHYVTGSIDGQRIRGCLDWEGTQRVLRLGAAWRRDNAVEVDATVEVLLEPDGHQAETLASDIAAALDAEPQAHQFFHSVAPFYRNNYIRWIESARRPETRRGRIAEMVRLLSAGQKQR